MTKSQPEKANAKTKHPKANKVYCGKKEIAELVKYIKIVHYFYIGLLYANLKKNNKKQKRELYNSILTLRGGEKGL